jgi:hypothetical protein
MADGESSPPTPTPTQPKRYKKRLSCLADVRDALAKTYRLTARGTYSPAQANSCVYSLAHLAKVLGAMDSDERLARIEEELAKVAGENRRLRAERERERV